ncbi:nuclear receptor-interacting protein 1 [Esox lucius]|uniref:Nuclear receptor interacting protein 1b n=1 Tax=Esox lucius TaxID=8010 RepID=A0A3P8ZAM5_ESOLU|nr:nuclear receptor-interacting protein 1 [Esox lucius]XP_010868972.1 nuclear receptor-interacting protein 1 [Esox lucius]XP_019904075.1 nuclear receptor-interacting protein 1 [Esox lucius]XP_034149164.1 nuclear receptor-interacting protein 1 [Esox lucius]
MTHGEEPGPETHTDSAVLTYLEGLLMHPVAAGPGATATRRSEPAHGHANPVEQVNKAARPFQMPSHGPAAATVQKAGNGPALHHAASQNLKKARLLRSGAWNEPGAQRLNSPPVELNGQGGAGGLQNGAMEGSPHAGESTLLASLLQSFSSRLQSVAMSQQSTKPPSELSPPTEAPPAAEKEPIPCYGMASSRLKGLMRKSKLQNHSSTPYSRRVHGQDRTSESPRSVPSSTPPSIPTTAPAATDAVSCAERLKAVANLVKIRSSPAPSPKPSVACSQLALLLSSEAHLQQYSREQALKAQLSGRSASERLAAMATQQTQDKRPPSVGEAPPTSTSTTAPDPLSSLTAQNGTAATALPRLALGSGPRQRSPSLLPPHSSPHPTPPPLPLTPQTQPPTPTREKRSCDSRPTRPPQTCSSLLLLLLNNHNNQKQLTKNGHLEDDFGVLPPSRSSSVTSDSECSIPKKSLAKREESCSDAEGSYSSCSPIDLSMRNKASNRAAETMPSATSSTATSYSSPSTAFSSSAAFSSSTAFSSSSSVVFSSSSSTTFSSSSNVLSSSSSSLDKLTESLLNKWKPDPSGPKVLQVKKELEISPDLKSHPKVTLMQLLLERRNNDKVNKMVVNPDLQHDATLSSLSRGPLKSLNPWEEVRTQSPLDRPGQSLPLYSLSRDPSNTPSPFSYPSPHAHVQSSPLDLCKSKPFPAEKAAAEPAFSASKLLQNLAQCGTASPSPPVGPGRVPSQELDVVGGRPLALLERLNAPIQRSTTTPLSDGPSGSGTPSFGRQGDMSPPSSQIENLLERRTVLQLLLGTSSSSASSMASATRRDRQHSSGRGSVETAAGGCYEKGTSVICDSSNGPSAVDVKVKTEPGEEVLGPLSSAVCEDVTSRKRQGGGGGGFPDRHSPLSEPQQDLRTEPRPTEVIAKYGLLSQLLKQQSATYYTSAAQLHTDRRPSPVPVKEEQKDYHHQGPSPKKRRLCSELAESLNNGSPQRAVVDGGGSHSSLARGQGPEEPDYHRGHRSPKEEAPTRSPGSEVLLPRESRGFNVLKQLLLSDNCLKELSQHPRGAPSPSVLHANGKANGSSLNLNQPGYNHHDLLNLPTLPWHHPHSSLNSGPPSHLRPLPSPMTGDSSRRSPWGRHTAPTPHQDSPKRDSTPVKQEPQSPVRWAARDREEEEGCDSIPDSPRLTRSNPILYYMLQKGSAQLRREMRDQAEGTQGSGGARVKEEPGNDAHVAYEHRLSSTANSTLHSSLSPPYNNDKHSHKDDRLSDSSDKW